MNAILNTSDRIGFMEPPAPRHPTISPPPVLPSGRWFLKLTINLGGPLWLR